MRFTRALIIGTAAMAIAQPSAQAAMTLLAGPSTATHVGNLVTNGSFEIGAPAPGIPNKVYWATGTANTPFNSPPGWTTSGAPSNYALWGDDNTPSPPEIQGSATLPDGNNGLYFGNGAGAQSSLPPTFNPSGSVTFPGTPTMTTPYGAPVVLSQSIPTNSNLAPYYIFSFWVSGEFAGSSGPLGFPAGIFGLRVTNVLAGDPTQFFAVPGGGSAGASRRYDYKLVPLNASLPIDVEFYNWGHFDLTPWGGANFTTELVLDDVIVNAVPEPASMLILAAGTLMTIRRRRSA